MDPHQRVKFVSWDKDKRTKEELEEFASLVLDKGTVVRKEGDEKHIVKWDSGNLDLGFGGLTFQGLGFLAEHYNSELEEIQETSPVEPEPTIRSFSSQETVQESRQEIQKKEESGEPVHSGVLDPGEAEKTKQEKFAFVQKQRLKLAADRQTFITPSGMKLTPQEVTASFKKWQVKKILWERLDAVIKLDGDKAREENGIGFSQWDTNFAHDIHDSWSNFNQNWTDTQTLAVGKLLKKYRRQIAQVMGEKYRPILDSQGLLPEELTDTGKERE